MTVTVDDQGRIQLPVEMLRQLGASSGSKLDVEADARGILLRPSGPASEKSLLAFFDETIRALPPEVVAEWPADGAEEHDHYIYGTPKKSGT
ncbi:MAG TPA: AbrB/MazE/SpoVT family DNA-binding domain-containing protein [Gemmataceae bacterium]|nr:AbrB/MazE/SpoVT family DNA-binding domain-containing protein [Gemmataceae bacterium]